MKEVVGVANSAYYKAASKTSFDIIYIMRI